MEDNHTLVIYRLPMKKREALKITLSPYKNYIYSSYSTKSEIWTHLCYFKELEVIGKQHIVLLLCHQKERYVSFFSPTE